MTHRAAPLAPPLHPTEAGRAAAFDGTVDARGVVQLERRARTAGHLADVVKQLNRSLEVERVYALVARHAMELLGAGGARLAIVEDGATRVAAAAGSLSGDVGRLLEQDDDVDGTCAGATLAVGSHTIGALLVTDTHRLAFDEDDTQLLEALAAHAAIAIENARLVGDLERRVTQITAFAQLQQAISAAASPAQVYRELYRAVAAVVDAPCFTLLRYDHEEARLVPELVVSDGEELDNASLPRLALGDGPTSVAYRTREPNVTGRHMPGWTGVAYERTNGRQIAVVLSAPIVHGDRALGVLQAQSYDPDAYDQAAVDLTMLIARQAGTAMMNAMALENERREREQAEAAATIARLALRSTDIVDSADELLEVIMRSSRAHGLALGAAAEDGTVRCVATRGRIGVALGEALTLESAAPELTVPLSAAGRVLGVLRAAPAHGGSLAERDVAALTRLADPLALALDTMLLRAEERRQESRQRMLAVALQTMDHPVFILSLDRRIRFANAAASRQYGYTNEELLGMSIHRLAVRPEAQREEDTLGEVLEGSGVWTGERLHRRKDGSELPTSVVVSAIRDAGGKAIGMVAVMRDLTDERRVAEQLRQSEKLVALGELVAGVAHEVNNPLTGISAMTQLLLEERLTDEQVESLRLIKREADRAVAVIRDLLTFARKTGPRVVPVEFNPLIEQTLRLRSYGLRTAGIEVVLQLDPELPSLLGDDRLLQQVLLNLIVNAEYAMQGGSHRVLTIRTFVRAQRVIVEVADTGCGMTPEVQKRIFEPFFTTKPDGRGTGLGLSVSYGIVQTHGGTLTVHTAPGAGATFRMSLPTAGLSAGASHSDPRT